MTNKEAIKWVEYVANKSSMTFDDDSDETRLIREKVYANIEQALLMAIKALEQTAWIPVEERLPEVGERVLVTKRVTRFRNETHIARYNVTRWCSFGTISNKNVLAWKPLLEPYRGGC